MKPQKRRLPILAVALLLTAPTVLLAGDDEYSDEGPDGPVDAQVYVVHGIPGTDVDPDLDKALPVDVLVNDALCVLEGFTFGEIEGPLPLAPGEYNFKISLANPDEPCGNAAVIEADNVPFGPGENATVIANLTEDGGLTASKFTNDLSPTRNIQARLIAQHTAAAPTVDIKIERNNPFVDPILVEDVSNGDQVSADLRPGRIQVSFLPANEPIVAFGPVTLNLRPKRAYLVYAVGSLSTGSFQLLVKDTLTQIGGDDDEGYDGRDYYRRMWQDRKQYYR